MIDIPDLGEGFLEMWRELLLLAKQAPAPWTLIGAHVVALHGWKAGRKQPRASKDADILVNARVVGGGTQMVSQSLLSRGFSLDGVSPEGIGHRFVRGAALSKSERRWLKRHPEFADPTSPCYQEIAHPTDAATVFRRLTFGSEAAGD